MQVSAPNDVKIYNLSAGKSLPEWLSDRKRRKLQQKDIDIRRRIELIQDFQMPDVSSCVQVSRDGQYIYATGTYKPRVRCYDVNNLSLKFERCLDADVIKMDILSDSYEKLVFLEEERFVEFHVQYGHYHRLRIPKFGRDMVYHPSTCDLYIVASGPDVYRLNLEQGRMMIPLSTDGSSLTACAVNPEHGLFACGTYEGKVEAFDPRSKKKVGILDCALSSITEDSPSDLVSVSSLKFKDALTMVVGMSNGITLVYDIRSGKPVLVKDQQFGLPIKSIDFVPSMNLIVSMDSRIVKFWNENDGKPYTAIEPGTELNQLCLLPSSGLMFIANEAPKILTYFMPSLGTAPKWCSFLDNITEELEEDSQLEVYDDYKFVTAAQLEQLGLSHLIGSNLLRAYMHGYFMDNRLYKKADAYANPFAYEKYKQEKIKEKLEEERAVKVELKKRALPKVNKDLAERLVLEEELGKETGVAGKKKQKGKVAGSLLQDDRFKALFENPDFQVNPDTEEFRLMNPALSKLEKSKQRRQEKLKRAEKESEERRETEALAAVRDEGRSSDNNPEESDFNESSSSSDEGDNRKLADEMRRVHKEMRKERRLRPDSNEEGSKSTKGANEDPTKVVSAPKSFELRSSDNFGGWRKELEKRKLGDDLGRMSLAERLDLNLEGKDADELMEQTGKGREVTFTLKKSSKSETKANKQAEHIRERRKSRRSASDITRTLKKHRFSGDYINKQR